VEGKKKRRRRRRKRRREERQNERSELKIPTTRNNEAFWE
jgi:hypothetical protein